MIARREAYEVYYALIFHVSLPLTNHALLNESKTPEKKGKRFETTEYKEAEPCTLTKHVLGLSDIFDCNYRGINY